MTFPRTPPMNRGFEIVFVGFWVVVVGVFDVLFGGAFLLQVYTYAYAEALGIVTFSNLTPNDGAPKLDVKYAYAVGGRNYTGDHYRYGMVATNDTTWSSIQTKLPVGGPVTVYYDPADPADAVLVRGPMGMDLFLLVFLAPFDAVAVGGLWHLRYLAGRPGFDPADVRRVVPGPDGHWTYRPYPRKWVPAAATAVGLLCFPAIFGCGFTFGFNPPLGVMAGWWAFVIATTALAAWLARDSFALIVDAAAEQLLGGGPPLGFADVECVSVTEETTTDSESGTTTTYPVSIARRGADPWRVRTFADRASADGFAAWVRDRVAGGSPAGRRP